MDLKEMDDLPTSADKSEVFNRVESYIKKLGFSIVDKDSERPWGGFLVIDESQAGTFAATFFPHITSESLEGYERLSPKILIVAPNKRLSWQYHHRRAEIWKVIGGNAAVVVSETDEETPQQLLSKGTSISLRQGERHRLIGVNEYGIVAEIWQHTDPKNPSDEDDIVRVQDDFGR